MIDIAIIILNHKMRAYIERCLPSVLSDIATSGLSCKLVLVDNDSGDGVLEWAQEHAPTAHTIQTGGNFGFAVGNNRGLRSVSARYYFVLNPDTEFLEPDTLKRLHDWMEAHPRAGIVAPQLLSMDGSIQYSRHRFPHLTSQIARRSSIVSSIPFWKKRISQLLMEDVPFDQETRVDWVQGSALFVRAEALDRVGYLDESYWMYFEDLDWCRRFWEAGHEVWYTPSVRLKHLHHRESAKVQGMIMGFLKSRLARKHVESWARYFLKWGLKRPRYYTYE